MPNITLLRPPTLTPIGGLNFSSVFPPISLGYLAAALKEKDFDVHCIDAIGEDITRITLCEDVPGMQYRGISTEEIIELIPEDASILGVSVMFSSEWPFCRGIIESIKRAKPHITIIAGGEHISALPEYTLHNCMQIDYCVFGEGEETIVDLCKTILNGGDFKNVDGIAFREKGNVKITNSRRRIRAVDEIPWPAWDLLPIEAYVNSKLSHGPYRGKSITILATRGCPYICKFCSNENMYGRSYFPRNPKDVVDEIENYVKKYKVECIEFADLTTMTKKSWIHKFCQELIDRNLEIVWQLSGGTRTEAIDEEIIIKAKEAGCVYLGFAPESGSKEVLKEINKQVNLPRMYNLFKIAKKHKMATRANIIIGFPNDTRRTILQSLWMQIKLIFLNVVDVPIFEFSPYPGSNYFRLLQKRGVIPSDVELDDYYFNTLGQGLPISKRARYCKNVGPRELAYYQLAGMSIFYALQYMFRPSRIYTFVKNFFSNSYSDSVFEQRISTILKVKFKFLYRFININVQK